MKKVQDINGNILEVENDAQCLAGVNGGLPTLLDPLKHKHIFDFMVERENQALLEKAEKEATAYIQKRVKEYGTPQEQIEFAVENGFQALIDRNISIKQKYPK